MIPTVSPLTAGLYIAKNASVTIPAPTLHEFQAVGSAPAATGRSHGEAISHTPRMTFTQSTQRRVVMTAPVVDAPLESCPEARLDLGALANISDCIEFSDATAPDLYASVPTQVHGTGTILTCEPR